MMSQALLDTVGALLADDEGLVAMDESNGTCNARFAKLAVWAIAAGDHAHTAP